MSRHRWYTAHWPFSLETLADKLRLAPFSFEAREGFVVDKWRRNALEARYIEQLVVDEETTDPFGTRSTTTRTTYYQTTFVVRNDVPLVELVDPIRSTQRFVSRLLELTDFSLVIAPYRVEVGKWAAALSTLIDDPHFVSLVQVSNVKVGPGVRGSFSFTGVEDVRPAAKDFLGRASGDEDKIQLRLKGGRSGAILLGANASATVSGSAGEELVDAARKSIRLLG